MLLVVHIIWLILLKCSMESYASILLRLRYEFWKLQYDVLLQAQSAFPKRRNGAKQGSKLWCVCMYIHT